MNTALLKSERTSSNETLLPIEKRQRCEVWTRVMGYHRPVTSFNIGKKGEFKERTFFLTPKSL